VAGKGTLNAGRRKGNSPLQWDIFLINPPLKGLKDPCATLLQLQYIAHLGPSFLAGGDFNSKNMLWGSRLITTKGCELAKVIQANNYSFLTTGTPTYWPTDANKIPDLLDFFIASGISSTCADVQPSYDLTSDHTPIIITISTIVATRRVLPRLHTLHTNWTIYKTVVHDKVTTTMNLKTREDIETAATTIIDILQHAAKAATPTRNPSRLVSNLPSDIKHLVAIKRRARSKWQKTHAPEDQCQFNNPSNKLKAALHDLQNATFTAYIPSLKCKDQTRWKPLKSRKKPRFPQSAKTLHPQNPGQRVTQKKLAFR
jgi:hypothetical protein